MNIFEITIQCQSELGWPVVVTQTAAGNFLPLRNEGTLKLSADDLTQLRRLQAQPKAYGTFLGKALFQDQIRDAFVKAFSTSKEGLRVLLNVEDDQLKSQISWQRLCAPIDGNWDFLALNQRVPLSLYLPSNTGRYFPPIGKRELNALILVASPRDLGEYRLHPFDVEETVSSLKKALGKIPTDVLANITNSVGQPTLEAFCRQLTSKRYTLLHIVCHGQFSHSGETILYWADQNHQAAPIHATNLLEKLKRQHKGLPYFTFLSTCESAVPAAERALGGLAQRMVKELGMPAVIAMTQKISIKTATFLSTEFYQRLRDRGEVDVALVEATVACAERFDILVPALFSRLRGQPLFSEILDRDLNNAEIEYGLSRLPKLLKVRSPISIEKFTQLNYTLQKTLKNDPEALSYELKEQRIHALRELNSLCNFIIDISFNALAFDQNPPAYDHRCPFRGLYPFKPENRAFFFGREPLVQELKQKLVGEHFLAVVGKSGCGKSSLVLAGLVPTLQEEQPELQLVYLTPDQDPLKQLLPRLSSVRNQPSIIVVDQFEELFTLCTDKPKRVKFIEKLIQLTQTHRVVITLRDDFLGECAVYPELRKYLETRQKLIAPMQPEELRRAMEQQAAQVGLQFEAGLSAAIFGDVKDEPGAMPLLQHALWELWKRRHGRWLVYREYEEIGTVKQAIARTADEFYHKLSPQEQQQVKDIFLRLTRLDDNHINYQERLDTRRRVEMEKLVPVGEDIAVIKDLVRRLANEDARLVVTSRNSVTGKEEVEVAHEALIRHWSKLQEWLNTNRNDLQIRERIRQQAEDWKQESKEECLLLQGGRLEDAERLLCQNPQFFNQQEADYIKVCSAFREQKQRQEIQKLRKWVSALTVALVMAVGSGLFAFRQATIANLRLDAARVEDLLESDPVEGLILAIKATGESQRKLRRVLPEVQASLYAAIDAPIETDIFQVSDQPVFSVALSPDGKQIVGGNADGKIWVRDMKGNLLSEFVPEHSDKIWSVALSPDAQTILSGSDDGKIGLWSLKGQPIFPAFQAHQGGTFSVDFSSDGQTIVSGGADNTIRLWNSQGKLIGKPFQGHKDQVRSVAFSPDGQTIVSGSKDGTIGLWDLQGNLIHQILVDNQDNKVWSVAFSPDGQTIVSGSEDGTVRLWNLQGKLITKSLQSHDKPVYSVAFSPDGLIIASASRDYTIRLWDTKGNPFGQPFRGHQTFVYYTGFSPDNKKIISTDHNGTLRLWDLEKGNLIWRKLHGNSVSSVAFSPNGKMIVSGSRDSLLRLWNTDGKMVVPPLEGHTDWVNSVAFSLDGAMIASGSSDNTVRLWTTEGKLIGQPLEGHTHWVDSVVFSSDSKRIISVGWDNTVRFWNIKGELIKEAIKDHTDPVISVAYSQKKKIAASSSEDKTVRLWDNEGNCIQVFQVGQDAASAVAFSPSKDMIVTGHTDGTLQLWNLEGQPIGQGKPFKGHKNSISSVAFSPNGRMIVSSSFDNTLRLWDLEGNQIGQHSHQDVVSSVAFSPDGEKIVSGSRDMTLSLWRGGSWKTWLSTACSKLHKYSTENERENQSAISANDVCENLVKDQVDKLQSENSLDKF
ncbi:MAG: CHAT domain-containing protein [Limnoraphis sp.]